MLGSFAHLKCKQKENIFPWMNNKFGEIACKIPKALASRWQVEVKIRVTSDREKVVDAAYIGIYAPREIARTAVSAIPGDESYQTVNLGTYDLKTDSRIWIMPGVTGSIKAIDVKEVKLIPANIK